MAELTQADRYLLDQIGRGDQSAWAQLVQRYQGRLLAFARGRLSRREEAEDLVQDTFIAFLEGLGRFRENASVETFLFTILRHKLIDFFRGRQMRTCFLQDVLDGSSADPGRQPQIQDSQQATASWYVRREEHDQSLRDALSDALDELIERLRKSENFRDLQIIEMLFYAQIRNKDAAGVLGMDEKQIALIKHRALREIREQVVARGTVSAAHAPLIETPAWEASAQSASLLTEVWEQQRPTCPKRSTLGRFVLGTLEPAWQSYVDFHVNKLGCVFCRANLDDLRKQSEEQPRALYSRVLQSTVGFFRQA
jgi:RNA polymerase sigma factor (sigma-70 family)